jgi:hypothetical protein
MASHITHEKEAKTMPAACKMMGTVFWDATGCILVFATRGNQQCCLLPSDTQQAALFTAGQMSMERIILQHHFSMCGEAFKRTAGNFYPSTIQSGPRPLRQPFVSVFKELDARRVLCNE